MILNNFIPFYPYLNPKGLLDWKNLKNFFEKGSYWLNVSILYLIVTKYISPILSIEVAPNGAGRTLHLHFYICWVGF